jgi:hypothetical protein
MRYHSRPLTSAATPNAATTNQSNQLSAVTALKTATTASSTATPPTNHTLRLRGIVLPTENKGSRVPRGMQVAG